MNKEMEPRVDTSKMTFEEQQAYVIKRLTNMGIKLVPGERKPGDGDFSMIIPCKQKLILK